MSSKSLIDEFKNCVPIARDAKLSSFVPSDDLIRALIYSFRDLPVSPKEIEAKIFKSKEDLKEVRDNLQRKIEESFWSMAVHFRHRGVKQALLSKSKKKWNKIELIIASGMSFTEQVEKFIINEWGLYERSKYDPLSILSKGLYQWAEKNPEEIKMFGLSKKENSIYLDLPKSL